jgi:hypothetical protein
MGRVTQSVREKPTIHDRAERPGTCDPAVVLSSTRFPDISGVSDKVDHLFIC